MSVQALVIIALAVALAAVAAWRMARAWFTYRGRAVVSCPENHQPAGVSIDAAHAATTALGGNPSLRLSACSRWPERAGCGQECLQQLAASPDDCLVRSILSHWYEGKSCASCGRPFGSIDWTAAKPALLDAAGVPREWNEVPTERLQETLAATRPLCFACYTAAKLARQHPELILDRGRKPV
jgi:hypothetical protein